MRIFAQYFHPQQKYEKVHVCTFTISDTNYHEKHHVLNFVYNKGNLNHTIKGHRRQNERIHNNL